MRNYAAWILRHRRNALISTLLVTVFLVLQLRNLQIVIDPDKTVPQTHPLIQATNRIEALFGNKFTAVIGVTAKQGDVFQAPVLAKVKRITSGMARMPTVVESTLVSVSARKAKNIAGNEEGLVVRPLMDQVPTTPEGMAGLREALRSNPAYANLIVSKDEKTLSVVSDFKVPRGFTPVHERLRAIADAERDDSVEITLGGVPVFLSLMEQYSARMAFLFPLAVLIIGLIHYEAFRTVQALVLPLLTALLAVLWGLGLMGLAGVSLDVFNASTPILILAVAAGHAVQILKRYYEEYHRARDLDPGIGPEEANRKAILEALTQVGPVMIAAGIIAALGFFSLVVFEIKTIQTFGIFTGLGILSALAIEMTLIPALRSYLRPPGERESRREGATTFWDRIVSRICGWVLHSRKAIYWSTAAILAAFLAGALQVRVDNSQKALFYGNLPAKQDDEKLNERLAGTNAVYLLVEGKEPDAIKDPKTLRAMDSVQRFLEKDPLVGKTVSLADFVRRIHRAMHGDKPGFDAIPDSRELIAQYLLLYASSGEPGDFDSYVDYGYQNASILAFVKTDSTAEIDALDKRLEAYAKTQFGPEVTVRVGGGTTGSVALNEIMVREKLLNIAQIMLVVFAVSSLLFRSALGGALVCVPLAVTVTVAFGALGLLGIPLQIFTALVSAMAVGIGADYAIYLSYRLREELGRSPDDEEKAVRRAFAAAGKAILFVSSAVAGGYSVLVLSFGFNLHLWMGVLIALAMVASSIAALTVFPALLLSLRPGFIFGRGPSAVKAEAGPGLSPVSLVSCAALLLGGVPTGAHASAPEDASAAALMEKNFLVSKVVDSDSEATFSLRNPSGQERIRKTRAVTKLIPGTTDNRRMVRFMSPPDVKGTVSLMIEHTGKDDDLWIYLPALKKVRRLVASNRKDSFVGTDFSYGDVIGHKTADWNHRLVRKEAVAGKETVVIESTPKSPEIGASSGYSRRVTWIDPSNSTSLKGEFYDQDGKLLKTVEASRIERVDAKQGKWQPMTLVMRNVQTNHQTTLTIDGFKTGVGVKDEYFTPRYMEKSE